MTTLDHGAIGHKIPHEYIASMHYRNRAPDGFDLHDGKSEGCNKVSEMFARLCGQKIAPPIGSYSIVTRANTNHDRGESSQISTLDSGSK